MSNINIVNGNFTTNGSPISGGSGSVDYIVGVTVSGSDLVFTGTGSAFSGNVTLPSGGGSQDVFVNTTSGNIFATQSLNPLTTGNNNVALGQSSLRCNTTGGYNVALGRASLQSNTTGNNNVALGQYSLCSNTTGFNNVALGQYSLLSNTTGSNNVALGSRSLLCNTTGRYNVALGNQTMRNNTYGNDNIAFGRNSLDDNTVGNNNIALGQNTQSGNYCNSIILGKGAVSTCSNQFVLGSSTTPIGTTFSGTGSNVALSVLINGSEYRLLLYKP